jgi:hypothetical protein
VRILDDIAIDPINLGPQEGIAEISLRQVPKIVAPHDGMRADLRCILGVERLRRQYTGSER